MADPIAGHRKQLAAGEITEITWDDNGQGKPVTEGQEFSLRRALATVTSVRRRQMGSQFVWVARFRVEQQVPSKPEYLGPGIRHVDDPDRAVKAGDESWDGLPEPDGGGALHLAHGEPPEPEVVPAEVVRSLPSTEAAKQRFARARAQEQQQRMVERVTRRLRVLSEQARRTDADLTEQLGELESMLDRIEAKQLPRAA